MKRENETPWERYKRHMDNWPFGMIDAMVEDIMKPEVIIPAIVVLIIFIIAIVTMPSDPVHLEWRWDLCPFNHLWNGCSR